MGWCALALLASSCAMKPQEDSAVSIRIPSLSELNKTSKVGALSYTWANACFMVTIRGEGIAEEPQSNVCSIRGGLFAGSVAAGSTLTVKVPQGVSRSLDLYVYFRDSASSACPVERNLHAFDPGSTVRVAQVDKFDVTGSDVNLNVEIAMPTTGTNLITQFGLAQSCAVRAVVPGPGSSTIVGGRDRQTGGNFSVTSVVSGRQSEKVLTGGSFKMTLSRRPGGE